MSGAVRRLLVALLLVATAAFVIGVGVERSQGEKHAEAASEVRSEGAESGEEVHAETSTGAHGDEGNAETHLGIDVALAMVAFAALDVREVVHQLDEDNGGLALLAGVVAALHLGVAAVALAIVREAGSGRRLT